MRDGCVFCDYEGPSPVLADYGDSFVIEPLEPVKDGHVLVIPRRHAERAEDVWALTDAMTGAGRYLRERQLASYNIIVSIGAAATQTVPHLHVHLLARSPNDGLRLPWSASEGSSPTTRPEIGGSA